MFVLDLYPTRISFADFKIKLTKLAKNKQFSQKLIKNKYDY